MAHATDQDLLQRLKHDEHQALEILFDKYWPQLFRTACARLNNSDLAQDIVQELFIDIWKRRSTLAINGSLENYLLRAVKFSVISHYRSRKVTEVQLEDALQRVEMLEDSVASLTDYLELEHTLQQAVDAMPEMLKRVYELRSENLSVKAIAGELGLADQTVKNYIGEVLRRLRLSIAEKHPEKHLTYMALAFAILHK